jgi:hypothetical protein
LLTAIPARSGGIVHFVPGRRPITVAGLDVGEDYLDLALIDPRRRHLELRRVALAGIEMAPNAIVALSIRLAEALNPHQAPIIALIDSPRWPSDLDCRPSVVSPRQGDYAGGRRIDSRLREFTRHLRETGEIDLRLSLFPTPRLAYFRRCIEDRSCKPHLRALGREFFGCAEPRVAAAGPRGGAIFTRFMLTGFAAFRALEAIGVTAFEAYPDLQFRLWREGHPLAPKSRRRQALADRVSIDSKIAAEAEIGGSDQLRSLDQADAAILALTAYAALNHGAVGVIKEPEEGNFAIPLRHYQAAGAGLLTSDPLIALSAGTRAVIVDARRSR